MSKPLDPALLFWCKHWDEMTELAERAECPPELDPADWLKFQEVVGHATRGTGDLLSTLAVSLEKEGLGQGLTFRKQSQRGTMEQEWYCQGAVALSASAREFGSFWFGIARDRAVPPLPVFVVAFYFAKNGADVGNIYAQKARLRGSQLALTFASDVVEDSSRWSILLSKVPIDETTTIELLSDLLVV